MSIFERSNKKIGCNAKSNGYYIYFINLLNYYLTVRVFIHGIILPKYIFIKFQSNNFYFKNDSNRDLLWLIIYIV